MENNKDIKNQITPFWLKFLPEFLRHKIESRDKLHKIVSNIGWLFFDRVLRMGVGLFVTAWVARYLGPKDFGTLNFAIAFVTLFSAIALLGLDDIVIRNLVNDSSSRDDILGTSFFLKLLGGTAMLLIAVFTVLMLRPVDPLSFWLVLIVGLGMIFQAFDVIDFWFKSQIQSKFVVVAKNVAFLFISLIKIILILVKASLIAFAWAGLGETVLGIIGLIIAFKMQGFSITVWRMDIDRAKNLLHNSWPLILSGLAGMIYLRIDQVLLAQMSSDKELGIYSAAVRLAEMWYFIPMAVYSSIFPSIVESLKIGEEIFYSRLQKSYNLIVFIGYVIAIPLSFWTGWLIKIIYGAAYTRAAPMLLGLIWAGFFVNIGIARSLFLMTMNWTRLHFLSLLGGAILNLALNIVLIPKYGGIGAVIASFFAYWVAAYGSCFLFKPLRKTGIMLTKAIIYPKVW